MTPLRYNQTLELNKKPILSTCITVLAYVCSPFHTPHQKTLSRLKPSSSCMFFYGHTIRQEEPKEDKPISVSHLAVRTSMGGTHFFPIVSDLILLCPTACPLISPPPRPTNGCPGLTYRCPKAPDLRRCLERTTLQAVRLWVVQACYLSSRIFFIVSAH